MKRILVFAIVLFSMNCYGQAQTVEYGKISENGFYDSYISKSGDTISIGDTLTMGKPSGEFGFIHIQQGGQRVAAWLSGKKVKITRIKSYEKKTRGYTIFMEFKGYGLLPVFIDFENAISAGEIINNHAMMTREQAINKLKEAKDLLDLQMMSDSAYQALKKKLTPIIMQTN